METLTTEDGSNTAKFNVPSVGLQVIADGFVSPIGVVAVPDESGRLAVIDQVGKIWMIDGKGVTMPTPFLDLSSKIVPLNPFYDERGLLGLAFHPDYAINGRLFVYYTAPPRPGGPAPAVSWDNLSRIAEFNVYSSDPDRVDAASERVILEIDQPQFNHEGGTVAFGPDGYLYISVGDGGGANDVGPGHVEDWYPVNAGGNGQDVEANLLGNILRIDIDSGFPYGIPSDNPFVGKAGLDEIYAYGFRNPFRFSFDQGGSRKLLVGDAGQNLWEEISVVEKGGNYGWNVKEGTHCFDAANPLQVLPSCPQVDALGNELIDPVIELKNWMNPTGGRATTVIGGEVYRGNSIPGFQGRYIFGTFSQTPTSADGELFIAQPAGLHLWSFQEIHLNGNQEDIGYYLRGFGIDLEGEVFVTASSILGPSGTTGKVLKLVLNEKQVK
ncbi:PQQ-dependent sugar dehydrogenase [Pontibacter sp. Tf4]|nr:PQQ-dependent sugar dehydrogenase [Pontibacter sp. Tf4]